MEATRALGAGRLIRSQRYEMRRIKKVVVVSDVRGVVMGGILVHIRSLVAKAMQSKGFGITSC